MTAVGAVPGSPPEPAAATAAQNNRSSRLFDATVVAAGLIVTALAVLLAASRGFPLPWTLLGAPAIAAASMFPLVLDRDSGGIEIGFDSVILVLLVVVGDPATALLAWCAGSALSQLLVSKRAAVKRFNAALGCIAGALAVATMIAIDPLTATRPRELLAVAAGCSVYFVTDYVVSAVSLALEDGMPVLAELRQGAAVLALAVFVAVDSLGYLAALTIRTLPWWAALLLITPLVTMLVAARALVRGNENGRRLGHLVEAARDVQALTSREEVLAAIRRHARIVVRSEQADLRESPAGPGEIDAPLVLTGEPLWIVAPQLRRAQSSAQADRQALATLATVAEDAFARLSLVQEMGHLAQHDALTGLANRALFLDRVEHAVARARRAPSRVAVMFLDLDGFKAVNDRFGHAAGDELLRQVAERVSSCVREGDTVARLGGDEFAVLIEDVVDETEVEAVCRRLGEVLGRDVLVDGHEVQPGASIGVALSTVLDGAGELVRNADMAMYRSKSEGKGRYSFYEPSLRADSMRRLELLEALRRDVAAGSLVVHYQPVVELPSGRVTGVEALVRWARAGSVVEPDAFIRLAEESGLVGEIGAWVLRQVVADVPALTAAAGRPLDVAVNLSAQQLRDPYIVGRVAVARAAVAPGSLVLELTENALVDDDEDSVRVLHELAAAGACIAIDDFGVGFSSIGYLQRLPVDVLKIDRSFTAGVDSDERADALVAAMVSMGRALGLTVVAEGVERPEQRDRLVAAGAARAQGYLFGRPLPLVDSVGMLQHAAGEVGAGGQSIVA
jgi:diguanylate cyclase (GGDEF)-like protein